MVPNQTIHYPIIHVNLKKFLNKIFTCSNGNSRKYRRCILQHKRHHCVLEATPFRKKCHFMSIFFCDSYLVITKNPSIKEYISWLPTPSSTSFVNGVRNGSCIQGSFNFLRSNQIHTSPVFLSQTTIGLMHPTLYPGQF